MSLVFLIISSEPDLAMSVTVVQPNQMLSCYVLRDRAASQLHLTALQARVRTVGLSGHSFSECAEPDGQVRSRHTFPVPWLTHP